jgi:hypothetical protein
LITPRFSIPSNSPKSATNQSGRFVRADMMELCMPVAAIETGCAELWLST